MGIENIVATIKSNEEQRNIVKSTDVRVVGQGQQGLYMTFTFPELRTVEQLIHIQVDTDPEMWILRSGLPQDKTYAANTVGISLYLAVGTTVTDTVNGTTLTTTAVVIGI